MHTLGQKGSKLTARDMRMVLKAFLNVECF